MNYLCTPIAQMTTQSADALDANTEGPPEEYNKEVIDLTLDSDEDVKPLIKAPSPVAGPSKQPEPIQVQDPFQRVLNSRPEDANLSYFCEDESIMTNEELLNRMTVDQLKRLAIQNKCTPRGKPKVCPPP